MNWLETLETVIGAAGGGGGKRRGRWRRHGNGLWGWLGELIDAVVRWIRPKVRGYVGERMLEARLRMELAGTGAVVKGPFMVRREDGGGTTEIDGLVVGPTGVYVLEAKTYVGEISGGPDDKEWKQILSKKTKRKFQNPLHQNYGHRQVISWLAGRRELGWAVEGIVAFSGEAKFRDKRPKGVMNFNEVAAYIKGRERKRLLTAEEVSGVVERVEAAIKAVTREEKRNHVKRLEERRRAIEAGEPVPGRRAADRRREAREAKKRGAAGLTGTGTGESSGEA